ncbi:hypothetical protein ACFLQV_00100 [Calditrichota bacterium]
MWIKVLLIALFALCIFGCTDADYENGMYWLNRENGEMAAKAFQRALKNKPKKWKNHVASLEAIKLWENRDAMILQLRETFFLFPDSTKSDPVYRAGTTVLGDAEYKKISAPYAHQKLSKLLSKEGDKPEILSELIITAAYMQDTVAAIDYYKRLLDVVGADDVPKDVQQELNFFVGPARLDWLKYDWIISNNPQDTDIRLARLASIALSGDSTAIVEALKEIIEVKPDMAADPTLIRLYGMACGTIPYSNREITSGSDACYSPDGRKIAFIRERGKQGYPDPYIYVANVDGSDATPVMKGVQHYVEAIAWLRYSPDGKWIYFYGSRDKDWQPGDAAKFSFYRIKPSFNSKAEKLTSEELLVTVPYFESNGNVRLVRSDLGSDRASVEIVSLNPNTGKQVVLSRLGEPVMSAIFSNNGDTLIFTTNRGMFSRHVSGGNINVDIAWKVFQYPVLSPNGRFIAAKTSNGASIRYDRTNGEVVYLGRVASDIVAFGKGENVLVTRSKNGVPVVFEIDLAKILPNNKLIL